MYFFVGIGVCYERRDNYVLNRVFTPIDQICDVLRPALDTYFPESSGVRIISEPGRFFVASAFTLAVNVIAKRAVPRDNSSYEKGKFLNLQMTILIWIHVEPETLLDLISIVECALYYR